MTGLALRRVVPGLAASGGVALVGWAVARGLHARVAWAPDAVVLALLLGMILRAMRPLPAPLLPGVGVMGTQVLEAAIMLLGLTTDLRRFASAGTPLVLSTVAVTAAALGIGRMIGRRVGLSSRHALLVASGNAICGNSAIVAVGRVIGASAPEVASSIASTALLSIALVLALPVIGTAAGFSDVAVGALAGMTVYAMPQVLAATFPVGGAATEIGTMVKLVRVMCLIPWLMWLGRRAGSAATGTGDALRRVLPGYLLVFLAGAAVRTMGLVPPVLAGWTQVGAHALTVGAMAAVGLSVEPASLRDAGPRTTMVALGSMVVLVALALGVVALTVA